MSHESKPEAADSAQAKAAAKVKTEHDRAEREKAERETYRGTSASQLLQAAARRRRDAEEKLQKHQQEARKHSAE